MKLLGSAPRPRNRSRPPTLKLAGGVIELTATLADKQLEALEARITAAVLERVLAAEPERLLTVAELATMLGTTSEWVRRHRAELCGYRLSDGGGRSFEPSIAHLARARRARHLTGGGDPSALAGSAGSHPHTR